MPAQALALESTLISHGLPYPQNLEAARALEAEARARRVQPRTIAVIAGKPVVGLDDAELQFFATTPNLLKLTRRDLAAAAVKRQTGATTVSATMFLAHRAGLRVFATGGLGGVHRENPRDVSGDLVELTQTPVAIVCAGAKAILDLPATLEFLETFGVPVLGFQTDEFPAFYSRTSGLPVQAGVDSADEAAAIIEAHWSLGNTGGVLICAPIPPADELPAALVDPWIEQASAEAISQHVVGKALTPFLLRRLAELSRGRTVQANLALLKNNVAVACDIVKALARRKSKTA